MCRASTSEFLFQVQIVVNGGREPLSVPPDSLVAASLAEAMASSLSLAILRAAESEEAGVGAGVGAEEPRSEGKEAENGRFN